MWQTNEKTKGKKIWTCESYIYDVRDYQDPFDQN